MGAAPSESAGGVVIAAGSFLFTQCTLHHKVRGVNRFFLVRSRTMRGIPLFVFAALLVLASSRPVRADSDSSTLPFLGDEARKRGIELPLAFGAGLVVYHLDRAIEISD